MAVTARYSILPGYPQSRGAKNETIVKITLTGTYVAGGFLLDPGAFGGFTNQAGAPEMAAGSYEFNTFARYAVWRPTSRFILHSRTTGAEIAGGTVVTGDVYFIWLMRA